MQNTEFQELIWRKGSELYRDMPWRHDTRPYYVLVSELMLQQTQVSRVIPKFDAFIAKFPDEGTLADASLGDVIKLWQGLGYNRRAKFLHEAAKKVVTDFNGVFPSTEKELVSLPGVGKNTAGALIVYAFNQPALFIETNIRTVYIHHFFADDFDVTDAMIMGALRETIDHEHPREWYWALMDYGSHLKASGVRNTSQSKHYTKQSPLIGSLREVRGQIIRELSEGSRSRDDLAVQLAAGERFELALNGLIRDGLVEHAEDMFYLTK